MNEIELKKLSRIQLSEKFNYEIKEKYNKDFYVESDWDLIIKIIDNFNNNIFTINDPYELFVNSISDLDSIPSKNVDSSNTLSNNDDLYSYSREDLIIKFNNFFELTYSSKNYSKENWNKLLSIKKDFNENINNYIFPVESYKDCIQKLNGIKLKIEESYKNKLLYNYTSEEFKERFNADFKEQYIQYNYSDENWDKVLEIYNNFNENILQTAYPFNLFTEARYELAQIEAKITNVKTNNQIASKLGDIANYIKNLIVKTYKTVKFTFRILVLNISSVIVTTFIHLILGTFIYSILPKFINDFMLQSIIGGIVFISLNTLIFFANEEKNPLNDPKTEIVKHSCTIPFYSLIFLIFLMIPKYPILEELLPMFYPHMWISAFTQEYVFSPMVSLIINCAISIFIYWFIRKKTEY